MKTILLGGGMVGQCYAQALQAQGHHIVAFCDHAPSDALRALAAELGASIHAAPGPWLAEAGLVVSAVFGTAALDLAHAAFPHLQAGTLYLDMTTADPQAMRDAEALAHERGVRFVDVAITGAVNLSGARTPLLCAGAAAEEAARLLTACGAPVQVVGERPGDAAELKLLRSIFTKGLEALSVECLLTAERKGLRETLFRVLADIDQGSLRETMESMVRTHIVHAGRRRNEVVEAQRQMAQAGVPAIVLAGVQQRFEHTLAQQQATPYAGQTTADALAWLGGPARP